MKIEPQNKEFILPKVLITGSSGFVGQYLSQYLQGNNVHVIDTYRKLPATVTSDSQHFAVGSIDAHTQWQPALENVDVIIHLAARVHVMQETHTDPLSAFRAVNTEGTLNLAKQAVTAGVKRFVYLSTIKVNGEQTFEVPFNADDSSNPQDPYAVSKFEAEQQLMELGEKTGIEIVIIRPPLVYGPGVKGNFKRLIGLISKSIPLPFSRINNSRSLVSLQNLCSLINVCLTHPKAVKEVFLVSDGDDLSTSELFERIALATGKKSRLFYLPEILLRLLFFMLNRSSEYERLFGSLQVDISKNNTILDWHPEVSVDIGISNAV